jgi:sensor c-di-GMP phosphodiesterase-like protein
LAVLPISSSRTATSLGLLQTVPVDILKVNKSFVDTITMAGRHAVIATALIQSATDSA